MTSDRKCDSSVFVAACEREPRSFYAAIQAEMSTPHGVLASLAC